MSNLVVIYIRLTPETACGALTLPHTLYTARDYLTTLNNILYVAQPINIYLGDGLGRKIQGETILHHGFMCASTLPRLALIKHMRTFPFSNYCLPLQMQPSLPLLLWAAGTFFNLLQVYLVYNLPLGSFTPLT